MRLLGILSVIYAAILVLAVAGSLILIWFFLRRIRTALAQTEDALANVQSATQALGKRIEPLRATPEAIGGALTEAKKELQSADEQLGRIVERLGTGTGP